MEACRQSGRNDVPELDEITDWEKCLKLFGEFDQVLLPYEKEAPTLKTVLESKETPRKILVLVGPEGGWVERGSSISFEKWGCCGAFTPAHSSNGNSRISDRFDASIRVKSFLKKRRAMKSLKAADVMSASQVVFILGLPVGHSLSPTMHNAAFEKLHLPWLYTPLDISPRELGAVIQMIRAYNTRGANVTVRIKKKFCLI